MYCHYTQKLEVFPLQTQVHSVTYFYSQDGENDDDDDEDEDESVTIKEALPIPMKRVRTPASMQNSLLLGKQVLKYFELGKPSLERAGFWAPSPC
jgi:hypothetical protein